MDKELASLVKTENRELIAEHEKIKNWPDCGLKYIRKLSHLQNMLRGSAWALKQDLTDVFALAKKLEARLGELSGTEHIIEGKLIAIYDQDRGHFVAGVNNTLREFAKKDWLTLPKLNYVQELDLSRKRDLWVELVWEDENNPEFR